VNWVKKGKRLKYFDVKKLEQIDGIWVPTEMHMTTKKGKTTLHKTVIKAHNVRFNQDLDDDLFTTRKLEKGL
jgi:outer membrane lipoprotein-sorting protein